MKMLVVLILLSSLIFPTYANNKSISLAEVDGWVNHATDDKGNKYYLDIDQVAEKNGYRYYPVLTNLVNKNDVGSLSYILHFKVDCDRPRKIMRLKYMSYDQSFGKGDLLVEGTYGQKWHTVSPNTINANITGFTCVL